MIIALIVLVYVAGCSLTVAFFARWDADDARRAMIRADGRLISMQRTAESLAGQLIEARRQTGDPTPVAPVLPFPRTPIHDDLTAEIFRRQLDDYGRDA